MFRVIICKDGASGRRGAFIVAAKSQAGFTLIELLAVISIVVVLAALVIGGLGQSQSTLNRSVCTSNLRTLATAVLSYAADHGNYPEPFGDGTVVSWDGLVLPYLKDGGKTTAYCKVLQCPEDKRPPIINKAQSTFPRSYKISSQPAQMKESPMGVVGYWDEGGETLGAARRAVQVAVPADTILLFENFTANTQTPGYIDNWQFRTGNSMGSGWASGPRVTGYRADGSKQLYHGKAINYAMADGHVESRDLYWPFTPHNRWNAIR